MCVLREPRVRVRFPERVNCRDNENHHPEAQTCEQMNMGSTKRDGI